MNGRIAMQSYAKEHEAAVHNFNSRMLAGGAGLLLPERSPDYGIPADQPGAIRTFLALQGDTVRGGYGLRRDLFQIEGGGRGIDFYVSPIAEGIIAPKFAAVGAQLLLDAMRKGTGLYVVGGGGLKTQSVKLYRAAGWTVQLIPFFFHVFRAGRFLRNIEYLRSRRHFRIAADVAAVTGMGSIAIRSAHLLQSLRHRSGSTACKWHVIPRFDNWADELWQQVRHHYSFTQSRAAQYLNSIYYHEDEYVVRLRVESDGRTIGWAVVVTGGQPFESFFGGMRVGLLLDCFGAPEDAAKIVAAATECLAAVGVDIVVSNQSHPAWQRALLGSGFLRGPSNFPLAFSPGLVRSFASLEAVLASAHLNRGHGDRIMIGPRRALPDGVKRNPKTIGMAGR